MHRAAVGVLRAHDGGMSTNESITAHPAPARRQRTAGHIVAIVAGALAILPAAGALMGGTAIAVAKAAATDDGGYFNTTIDRISSDGVAVATSDTWFDGDGGGDDEPWVLDWLDLDIRLRVDGAADSDQVFVGIARTADVQSYLDGSTYSIVDDIDDHTPVYRQATGGEPVADPADQDFWVASATGTGEQEVRWDARGGRWSIVVLNADGTPGVDADVEFGAKSGAVTPIMVTLYVFGGLGLLVSLGLIVWGARGRKRPYTSTTSTGPLPAPTPAPAPAPAPAHDEQHPTPVA